MSADNGIYILKTLVSDFPASNDGPFEYRVAYCMAVDNYLWDGKSHTDSHDPNVWIKNAREMWTGSVFCSHDVAMKEAARQEKEHGSYLEYGICEIFIPRKF